MNCPRCYQMFECCTHNTSCPWDADRQHV